MAMSRTIAAGRYSDLHIAAFSSACAGSRLALEETIDLTRVMVNAGERITWGRAPIANKRSNSALAPLANASRCVAVSTALTWCSGR
jgi:thymidine phosphorylase